MISSYFHVVGKYYFFWILSFFRTSYILLVELACGGYVLPVYYYFIFNCLFFFISWLKHEWYNFPGVVQSVQFHSFHSQYLHRRASVYILQETWITEQYASFFFFIFFIKHAFYNWVKFGVGIVVQHFLSTQFNKKWIPSIWVSSL